MQLCGKYIIGADSDKIVGNSVPSDSTFGYSALGSVLLVIVLWVFGYVK